VPSHNGIHKFGHSALNYPLPRSTRDADFRILYIKSRIFQNYDGNLK